MFTLSINSKDVPPKKTHTSSEACEWGIIYGFIELDKIPHNEKKVEEAIVKGASICKNEAQKHFADKNLIVACGFGVGYAFAARGFEDEINGEPISDRATKAIQNCFEKIK